MNHIDVVYYINLEHRQDRRDQIHQVFDDLKIPMEKVVRIQAHHTPTHGTIGCAKSHMDAVSQFLASNHKVCMILEDDFVYEDVQRFHDSLDYVFTHQIPFDLIQLSYNHNGLQATPTDHPCLQKVQSAGTISGILLHKKFAPILLQNYQEGQERLVSILQNHHHLDHNYIIDVYWKRLQPQHEWYCFCPRLGFQRPSYSDIEKGHRAYGC